MSMNAVQFQHGLSLPRFQVLYGKRAATRTRSRCGPLAPRLAVLSLRLQAQVLLPLQSTL